MRVFRSRAGTTLVELMVAMVVMGIIGAGLIRLMTTQSRFFNDQEGQAHARRVARAGINLLLSDLRMVDADSGVISASPTNLSMRVPYRMGVSCGTEIGLAWTNVALQPVDSMMRADAGHTGWGLVDTLGVARYVPGGIETVIAGTNCTSAGVDTVPGGRVIQVAPGLLGASAGLPMFQYERVRYFFATSVSVPGTRGLFRTLLSTAVTEEIAAPFLNTAQFMYYVPGSTAPVTNPPAGSRILGVDMRLVGLNERNVTAGQTQQAPFETVVYFKNR